MMKSRSIGFAALFLEVSAIGLAPDSHPAPPLLIYQSNQDNRYIPHSRKLLTGHEAVRDLIELSGTVLARSSFGMHLISRWTMEDTLNSSVQNFTANQMQLELKLESQFQRGANWFLWIAGTSIINSIIILTGGQWHLVIGLGITQIFDEVAIHLAAGTGAVPLKIVALV